MREIFLEYAKTGVMTKEELAKILKLSPENVRAMAKAGKIPRIEGIRLVRFDPMAVYRALFERKAERSRSLTIKRHKTRAKTDGGYRRCL